MSRLRPELYAGREQAYAKHFVLESYLEKLAYKVGWHGAVISYIDGFAGQWQSKGEQLEDTSPHIAVRVLRTVCEDLRKHGRPELRVRAMFIEKDDAAFLALEKSFTGVKDIQVLVKHGEFEAHIPDAVAFTNAGPKGFSFTFIDPCGWTGYGLNAIAPLLALRPGEVLINFMTNWINQFIDDPRPQTSAAFEDLFGSTDFRGAWAGLQGLDRQDAMVEKYCERVRESGSFGYVVSAVIISPLKDRAHYHLVYATRHAEGLRTFRETERWALRHQADLRAGAQQQKRQRQSGGQKELFSPGALASPYVEELERRYRTRAKKVVDSMLIRGQSVPFDAIATAAMQIPMIAEQDARDLLMEQVKRGAMVIEGLRDAERKPRWNQGHSVRRVH